MDFDLQLAIDCTDSFSRTSGLGCVLTNAEGEILHTCGLSCANCDICALAGREPSLCQSTRKYGLHESERFGGKYIYFCTMGLTCFTSPILGPNGGEAQLTAGPFLMVDAQDYATCDLAAVNHIEPEQTKIIMKSIKKLPYIEAERVNSMSNLLFMAVAFMNNVARTQRMMETQKSEHIQGQISDYIFELKQKNEKASPYPYQLEHRFLQSLAQGEDSQAQTQKLLNELLGHIMFSTGGSLDVIRNRIYELLILLSRTAAERGGDQNMISCRLQEYQQQIFQFSTVDDLCLWLSGTVRSFMNLFYSDRGARYTDLIHRTIQYMQIHYAEKISLEDIARSVFLSPTYLSRTFKRETGVSLVTFLNRIRIEKSKEMLAQKNMNMLQVAYQCGFDSQSYFSRVFKEICGITPQQYRVSCQ